MKYISMCILFFALYIVFKEVHYFDTICVHSCIMILIIKI